ncbi:MAG: OmpA/MotB domain protein [Flavipsychrobacter sp.]|nr:OmpA/MotB domain protein [Flavipsychrobacter sp.]
MRKFTLTLALAATLPLMGQAQRYMGIATSNWSGTNGLYLNPANAADSRHKFTIDLFNFNVGADNSLAKVNLGEAIGNLINREPIRDAFTFGTKEQFSILAPAAEVRLPGFFVNINGKHGIGLTTRIRAMSQFHNFNQNLYKLITDSVVTDLTDNQRLVAKDFNFTANGWSEIGLTYGGVIYDKGQHMIKGGATVRYLMGAAYASITSNNIDAEYLYDEQNIDATLRLTNTDFHLSHKNIDKILSDGDADVDFSEFFGGSAGSGIGADLGFVYEWRPDHADYRYDMDGKTGILDASKNAYKLRFSAALSDLGSIKYKSDEKIDFNTNTTKTTEIRGTEIFDKIGDTAALAQYMESRGMTATRGAGETKVGMPTTLIIGADYHAVSNLYVNGTYFANMRGSGMPGNRFYNQFTVTPRWDTRIFSASIPLTYSTLSSTFRAGLGLRVGGFFIGSDDLFTFGGRYSANFYMGAYVPFNKKRPRDSDGDMVSNKKDRCKHEKGVWEMKGCPDPDKDGDGVLDKEDNCPDVAGSKTAAGCPDADMDAVADAEDRCPQEAGDPAMQGCPDRDKDGLANMDDACPDLAGLAQFKGCPDTDNDGIADNEDKCPNAAGNIANEGCPDTDNDGIADNTDKCPQVAGTVANAGCPEVKAEVKKRLAFAATAIQFDLGKATIKKTSNKVLDEVVAILNDYPDYDMTIEGHSDNVGNPTKNLELSEDRANAVKAYFVSKGIDAGRLSATGYGDSKPVASNKTAAGRAKNRRVAMDLKLR